MGGWRGVCMLGAQFMRAWGSAREVRASTSPAHVHPSTPAYPPHFTRHPPTHLGAVVVSMAASHLELRQRHVHASHAAPLTHQRGTHVAVAPRPAAQVQHPACMHGLVGWWVGWWVGGCGGGVRGRGGCAGGWGRRSGGQWGWRHGATQPPTHPRAHLINTHPPTSARGCPRGRASHSHST